MKLYLIGYMASGKSTVGQELAKRLAYNFVDIDDYIEKQQGKSIYQIFWERGEDYFRHIESVTLHDIAKLENDCVIATGGGTSCFYSNIDFMNADGLTIYLRLDVTTLVSRLVNDHSRPLVDNKTESDLNGFILEALNIRRKFYEKAQIILDVDEYSPAEIASIIENIIVQHN